MTSKTAPKQMISFGSDNVAGVSPKILEALISDSSGGAMPYGADEISQQLQQKMSGLFETEVSVLLVPTGTAANSLCLASMSPAWGAVLCHPDSHINNDECGAPEFFSNGVKLISIDGADCKIDPIKLSARASVKAGDVHSVQPSAVSVTQATETGSIYSLEELQAIGDVCKKHNMKLHMDGARFANAIAALGCSPAEMTWKAGVDALSFGATKNGAFGVEAVVLFDKSLATELEYRRKRSGHLMSKMRFLSSQIDAYITDNLWLDNANHANAMASKMRKGLSDIDGVELINPSETNIIFCKLPLKTIAVLDEAGFQFYHGRWEEGVVRLVTSFSTTEDEVDAFVGCAASISG
ncbi:low specificity L-threonine aldolase [Vibrio hannami]|uniref:threonine aldolase family protein n=1 Tax=Vibrio hannami TaxID=2717094 RepID=UPI00240FE195|nr:low specificity L-threonine aldolase [Vibrio hannami]MDG3085192.1 low specificity L-threonine aldolase [Vibrio hannami]